LHPDKISRFSFFSSGGMNKILYKTVFFLYEKNIVDIPDDVQKGSSEKSVPATPKNRSF